MLESKSAHPTFYRHCVYVPTHRRVECTFIVPTKPHLQESNSVTLSLVNHQSISNHTHLRQKTTCAEQARLSADQVSNLNSIHTKHTRCLQQTSLKYAMGEVSFSSKIMSIVELTCPAIVKKANKMHNTPVSSV